ncbi:energy-coupling factor ABC transporter permease [Calothrix sp. CCY 0018]|uniref:energy-coupling factor ABC transporter permease n=1 Tax=Calothrix sp. CCY 0018 TaxID=3103864 RepID=UPI0039C68EB3
MHIPDGFVSVPVAAATTIASVAGLGVALVRSKDAFGVRRAPVLGLTTAFIFAAQMINFPVAGGTSGHLLGGTLAAIVLGSPWAGALCSAIVLIIQAVLFADGGITALGANIFNIGFVGVWVGWLLTQTLHRLFGGSKSRLHLAAGIAAAVSVPIAAIFAAIELAISGTANFGVVLPAMAGVHILIGIGEGLITGGVLAYLVKARPDLLPGNDEDQIRSWVVPVVSIFLIAGLLSLFASAWPDGLEKVAEDSGFIDLAEQVRISVPTPFADYTFNNSEGIGTSIAGIIGSIACFGVAWGIAQVVKPKNA